MKPKKQRVFARVCIFLCIIGVVLIMTLLYSKSSVTEMHDRPKGHTMKYTTTPAWLKPHDRLIDGDGKSVFVAIGGGLCFRNVTMNSTPELNFLRKMLPSFCRSVEPGMYKYGFYFAYDYDDPQLSKPEFVAQFRQLFDHVVQRTCHNDVRVTLTLLKCNYTGKPAWAQNDAMLQAYLEGAEYFYRINDDTEFSTNNWVEIFVKQLSLYNPTNVGVVGPNHDWGNKWILTYDFVHRTHIELFGYYYPRELPDWHADAWITCVYQPNRSKQIVNIKVKHTNEVGTRYAPDHPEQRYPKAVALREEGKQWISIYVRLWTEAEAIIDKPRQNRPIDKVIIFVMPENKPDVVFGCIRNAQLARIFFPTWLVRVFIGVNLLFYQGLSNVVTTLHRLGAEVVWLSNLTSSLNISLVTEPSFLSLVGVINSPESYILVRDAEFRLSEREKFAVDEWVQSNYTLHTIRDHPSRPQQTIVPNLWGLHRPNSQNLNLLLVDILKNIVNAPVKPSHNMPDVMTPFRILLTGLNHSILYHDSISKTLSRNMMVLHPVSRSTNDSVGHFIGQKFDWNMLPKT